VNKKKATKKTTTESKKDEPQLCGDCDNWLETNECNHPGSPCHGGRVNAEALACDYFQQK